MQVRFPFVSMWKVSVQWTCQTFTCILCSLFIFTFPPWFTANTKKPCLYFQLRSQTTKRPPPEREQTPARPHSHVWIFKTLPCFPCELSSLTLSVIYKWLLSLIHMGLCGGGVPAVGCVSSPVSSFLICPKHIHCATLGKDRTNCSKSVTPESEMPFFEPNYPQTPQKQKPFWAFGNKWFGNERGEIVKKAGRGGEEGKSVYHTRE